MRYLYNPSLKPENKDMRHFDNNKTIVFFFVSKIVFIGEYLSNIIDKRDMKF
jgi:hypothetical protein